MTRPHVIVSPKKLARLQRVYENAEEWDPDWSSLPDLLPLARLISVELHLRQDEILLWLGNPEKYSPYPDAIALERAWNWDWPVVENLSDVEWSEFITRVALDPDPWGESESYVTKSTKRFYPTDEYERSYTARYSAWLSGTPTQRARMDQARHRRRENLGLIKREK